MHRKKILFITGTRADFGKLKPLMKAVDETDEFELFIFATGMHTLKKYGYTIFEIQKSFSKNIHVFFNQVLGEATDLILANSINGLSRYVHELNPDLIIVHGDRVETLAGSIIGALRNILVAHIEGGEKSGTVDDLIRHSVTKLAHLHFVSNKEAAIRLKQLGENPDHIFIIGSPDIDVMLSPNLPSLKEAKMHYNIPYEKYAIVLFHSVTTELNELPKWANEFTSALIESNQNYIIIFPNNDVGCEYIFESYKRLENNCHFRIIPSIRFEYFLALLNNSEFIIGNSSAGIREAPVYAIYSINVGTRQKNRFQNHSIINCSYKKNEILQAIEKVKNSPPLQPSNYFGDGNSVNRFIEFLKSPNIWSIPKQKEFFDLKNSSDLSYKGFP